MKATYEDLEKIIAEKEKEIGKLRLSAQNDSSLFSFIFKNSPLVYSISEIHSGKIIEVNDTFEKILGYSKDEVIGKSAEEIQLISAEDKEYLFSHLMKGECNNIELTVCKKNGEPLPCLISAKTVKFNNTEYLILMGNDALVKHRENQSNNINFRELFAMFNGFEGPAYIIDMETFKILAINKYTHDMFGKNIVGDYCYNWFTSGDPEHCKECPNSLLLNDDQTTKPTLIREYFSQITQKWYQSYSKAIKWENDKYVKLEISLDITERKLVEEAHKNSELQYKTLLKHLPDAIMVHDKGNISFISDAIVNILGYEISEIIGKTIFDFLHPEDQALSAEMVAKRLRNEPSPETYEVRVKAKNGNYKNFEVRGSVIEYGSNKVTLNVLTDITNKKITEHELQASNARFKNLVDHAVDGIFHGDTKGNFIGVNARACEMTGYSEEELLKMNMSQLFSEEEAKKKPLRYDLLQQGETVRNQRKLSRKDGTFLEIEMNTKMMPDKTYQAFFRDFTERLNLEHELIKSKERAEESDRLKSAFLANMSHEIRTPLNGILGFAELLLEDDVTAEKRFEFLSIINNNGKQLLGIINDIIDISKIESGQLKLNNAKCFLNQFMYEIYSNFSNEIPEEKKNNLDLKLNIPLERSILVYIDDVKIRQVISNLITNAIKFTNKGFIELGYSVDTENYIIQFYVKDSGIGLPAEKQSIIFERFRQADDTTTRKYGGTGLGLAISKGLVEIMEGKIWVASIEGKGSEFYFTIPYKPVIINENILQTDDSKISFNWAGKTILIVEDDFDSFLYLETMLDKYKAKLIHAENGQEAVKFCESNKNIDIILMDIQTPVLNGYEATKIIREFNNKIPIIAQTANAFEEDREKCFAAGCTDFIAKPIEIKNLFAVINKYIH